MHLDVQDLRNFYYRSTLGRAAQSAIRGRMQRIWPDARNLTVVGFGFAVPLLRPYLADARRVVALMPGPQGVMHWPAGMPNVSVLSEETFWPLETGHVDRLVVMHGLETSDRAAQVLEECWRVLGPGGRALFIVPSRGGLWARRDVTPFGYGRPYSGGQLDTLLKGAGFTPGIHAGALYQPPSSRRFWLRTGAIWEGMGQRMPAAMAGGVLMVEASKRAQIPSGPGVRDTVRNPLGVLAPKPEAKPA